jgi:hypothetical protein
MPAITVDDITILPLIFAPDPAVARERPVISLTSAPRGTAGTDALHYGDAIAPPERDSDVARIAWRIASTRPPGAQGPNPPSDGDRSSLRLRHRQTADTHRKWRFILDRPFARSI